MIFKNLDGLQWPKIGIYGAIGKGFPLKYNWFSEKPAVLQWRGDFQHLEGVISVPMRCLLEAYMGGGSI